MTDKIYHNFIAIDFKYNFGMKLSIDFKAVSTFNLKLF